MAFQDSVVRDSYLLSTEVENLYINETMLDSPGDFVKVYLYGLYSSKYQKDISIEKMSSVLNMPVETVNEAFRFYENLGLLKRVNILSENSYDVLYISQRERLYSALNKEESKIETGLIDKDLKSIYTYIEAQFGRPLSGSELSEVTTWKKDFNIPKEVITYAVKYCVERGKINIKYIEKVILSWNDKGFKTAEDIENYLKDIDKRQSAYKKILSSIGITRNATKAEKDLMDKWFIEKGFTLERILEASAKTISAANPSIKYLNGILESIEKEAKSFNRDVNSSVSVTASDVAEYYKYLRTDAERKAEERKEEVYGKLPEIRDIDIKRSALQKNITLNILKRENVDDLRRKASELEARRAYLLTEANLPMDYTDIKYKCSLCRDSGMDENGRRCTCYNDRFKETEIWQKKQTTTSAKE